MSIIVPVFLLGCNTNLNNKHIGTVDNNNTIEMDNKEVGNLEDVMNEESAVKEVYPLMTVDEFREFYSITEEQLTDIQIEDYIIENWITKEAKDYTHMPYGEFAIADYQEEYGVLYSVKNRTYGDQFYLPLTDFIDDTQYIFIEFNVRTIYNDYQIITLAIDYKHMQLFYCGNPEFYNLCELTTDLTEEDKAKINKDILTHINEDQVSNEAYKESSYEYTIIFADNDGNYIKIENGSEKDDENFPGFDEYWKGLCAEFYGDEFDPDDIYR